MLKSITQLAFKWTLSENKETTEFVFQYTYEMTIDLTMSHDGSSTQPYPTKLNSQVKTKFVQKISTNASYNSKELCTVLAQVLMFYY